MEQIKGKVLTSKQLIEKYKPMFNEKNIPKVIVQGLPYVSIGRKRYFIEESVDAWLHEQERKNNTVYPGHLYLLKNDDR